MKNLAALIVFSILSCSAIHAQQKELAITFSGFEDFGFSFRTGSATALWRINALSSYTNSSYIQRDSIEQINSSLSLGVGAGHEWRTPLDERLDFRYGLDLSIYYNFSKSSVTDNSNTPFPDMNSSSSHLIPGLNLVLGLNYKLSPRFLVGVEALPGIRYRLELVENSNGETTISRDNQAFSSQLSLNSVLLSVAYVLK